MVDFIVFRGSSIPGTGNRESGLVNGGLAIKRGKKTLSGKPTFLPSKILPYFMSRCYATFIFYLLFFFHLSILLEMICDFH